VILSTSSSACEDLHSPPQDCFLAVLLGWGEITN
jgi:hypothetical protein